MCGFHSDLREVELHLLYSTFCFLFVISSGSFSGSYYGCHLFEWLFPSLFVHSILSTNSCITAVIWNGKDVWLIHLCLWHTECLQNTGPQVWAGPQKSLVLSFKPVTTADTIIKSVKCNSSCESKLAYLFCGEERIGRTCLIRNKRKW